MPQPIALSPAIISALSRECSGLRRVDGVFARAARISARFVADFEPGIVIEAVIGLLPRNGARHKSSALDPIFSLTTQAYLSRYSCRYVRKICPRKICWRVN